MILEWFKNYRFSFNSCVNSFQINFIRWSRGAKAKSGEAARQAEQLEANETEHCMCTDSFSYTCSHATCILYNHIIAYIQFSVHICILKSIRIRKQQADLKVVRVFHLDFSLQRFTRLHVGAWQQAAWLHKAGSCKASSWLLWLPNVTGSFWVFGGACESGPKQEARSEKGKKRGQVFHVETSLVQGDAGWPLANAFDAHSQGVSWCRMCLVSLSQLSFHFYFESFNTLAKHGGALKGLPLYHFALYFALLLNGSWPFGVQHRWTCMILHVAATSAGRCGADWMWRSLGVSWPGQGLPKFWWKVLTFIIQT